MQPLTNPKPGNTLNGASRLAAEVSGHYGALGIVALRDGSMCDAKLVHWESYFVTLRVQPLRTLRIVALLRALASQRQIRGLCDLYKIC